jgi:hypothetical protein
VCVLQGPIGMQQSPTKRLKVAPGVSAPAPGLEIHGRPEGDHDMAIASAAPGDGVVNAWKHGQDVVRPDTCTPCPQHGGYEASPGWVQMQLNAFPVL